MRAITFTAVLALSASAFAAPQATTQTSTDVNAFNALLSNSDLIAGKIGTELAGDTGWHPANTNPVDQLPALTDGVGPAGLAGLLNDFPPAGAPTKIVQYTLDAATDVTDINILSANPGADGRVFMTAYIQYSTDNGANFQDLGFFASDTFGIANDNGRTATFVNIADDQGGALAAGVTDLIFNFYAVSNTQGAYYDPFDGVNPFTGVDDGNVAAIESPLITEIDVLPEPTSLALLALGALCFRRR